MAFDLDARLLDGPFAGVTVTGGYRNRYRAKTRRLGDTETEFGGRNDLTGLGLRLDLLYGARLKGALYPTPERGPGLESELKLIQRRDEGGGRRDRLQLKGVVDFTPLLPLPEQPDDGPLGVRPFVEGCVKLEMGGNRSAGESESWLDRGILLVAGGWRF